MRSFALPRWRFSIAFACLAVSQLLFLNSCSASEKSSARTSRREIWVSSRSAGETGNGTQAHPFDGSTAWKFDLVMKFIPAGAHIYLSRGTFLTIGTSNCGIRPKEGWIIEGAGKDLTTIKLADGKATQANVAYRVIGNNAHAGVGFSSGFLHYVSVRNLTIDCNKLHQPVYLKKLRRAKLYAIRTAANNARIINVRAINIWNESGKDLQSEGFPLNVQHDGLTGNNDLILFDGCEVINPEGYHTAISAFSALDAKGGLFKTIIRNCRVVHHRIGSCFGQLGSSETEIFHNYAYDCGTGTTMDTGNFSNVRIHNNRLVKMHGRAVNMFGGAGRYSNIAIYDNYFDLASDAFHAIGQSGRGMVRDIRIIGNTIIQRSKTARVFVFKPGTTGIIRDNIIWDTKASDLSQTNLVVESNRSLPKAPRPVRYQPRTEGR